MRRFASGLPLTGAKVPVYDENDERPDPRAMDLTEIQDELDDTAEKYAKIRKDYAAKTAEQKQEEERIKAQQEAEKVEDEKFVSRMSKAIKRARKPSGDE